MSDPNFNAVVIVIIECLRIALFLPNRTDETRFAVYGCYGCCAIFFE